MGYMFLFITTVSSILFVSSVSLVTASNFDDDTLRGFLEAFDSATRPTPTPRYRQWDRYLANDSLIGLSAPCSAREKNCLSRRRLFDSETGRCVYFGDVKRGEPSCRWALDVQAIRDEVGVRATCIPLRTPNCLWGYRMAFDGRCFDGYRLFTRICARTRGLEPGLHASGGVECTCSGGACDREEYEDGETEDESAVVEARDDDDGDENGDEDTVNQLCTLPPLHAPVTPPTEAPAVEEVFTYHFDHSHERNISRS